MTDTIYKYVAKFSKMGDMVYISHLDLMTLFRRAIRRMDLPYVLTKGFTPRIKLSMPQALKLGVESCGEEATLFFREKVDEEKLVGEFNEELPEGIRMLNIEPV